MSTIQSRTSVRLYKKQSIEQEKLDAILQSAILAPSATNMPVSMRFGSLINGKYSILDRLQYKYDSCGNITEIRENDILQARYEYDKLNRIVREDNKVFGKTWLYSYDYNGNILSKKEYAFTLKTDDELEELDSETVVYGYYGDRLMSFGEELCDYDLLGNPTTYRNNDLSWIRGRQLDKFGSLKFTYDGQGRRTKKGDITFTYDSNGKLLKQSNGISFIYDESGVVGLKYGNKTYIYRKDVQGNIIAILDSTGDVVVEYTYDAWGNHIVTPTDEAYSELSQLNPFRCRGYYYDTETNLYYLKTRYYDPEVGRFITIDDLSYLDPDTINGLNLYAYCGDNPIMRTDSNGSSWWSEFWGWFGTAVLLVGLAALTICTLGAAAPITGTAATLVVGATIGAFMGVGASIFTQGINNGWDNISGVQVFRDGLGGAMAGAISAIPTGGGILGLVESFGLGGAAAVVGGMINGTVTDLKSAAIAFGIGGIANVAAKLLGDGLVSRKTNKIMNQGRKAKSLSVQKLQASPFNMGASAGKGCMRNAFKDVSANTVRKLVEKAYSVYRLGIYSGLTSAGLSTLPYVFMS